MISIIKILFYLKLILIFCLVSSHQKINLEHLNQKQYLKQNRNQDLLCAQADLHENLILQCPKNNQVFTKVNYVSFGNPTGKCTKMVRGPCDATDSLNLVESYCLGKSKCQMNVTRSLFRENCQNYDQSLIKLYVLLTCTTNKNGQSSGKQSSNRSSSGSNTNSQSNSNFAQSSSVIKNELSNSQSSSSQKQQSNFNQNSYNKLSQQSQQQYPQIQKVYSYLSAINANFYLRHRNFEIWNDKFDSSNLNENDASFRIVQANNGRAGYVSFQSVNYPDRFLRHQNYFMNLHPSDGSQFFKDDSSFRIVPALNGNSQQISIESYNFPKFYIRSDNYRCKIAKLENNNDFRNQASWKQTVALINRAPSSSSSSQSQQSQGQQQSNQQQQSPYISQVVSYISAKNANYYMVAQNFYLKTERFCECDMLYYDGSFRIVQANNGQAGYVSFQSINYPNRFLRYDQDYFIMLHPSDGSQLFRDESSFKIVPALNRNSQQISISTFKYPGSYIRQENQRCKIVQQQLNDDFNNDASWEQTNALINIVPQSSFKSQQSQGQQQSNQQQQSPYISQVVSYISAINANFYLRYRKFIIQNDRFDGSDLNKKDASFKIVQANNGRVGYVSFESVNHPDRFLRHFYQQMKLDKFDESLLFRDETSFRIVPALNGNNQQISIESFNYPGFYIISDNNYRCKIAKLENNNDFRNQASWQQTDALINKAPSSSSQSQQSQGQQQSPYIYKEVSYISAINANFYLRNRNFIIQNDRFDGSDLNKKDASFKIVQANNGRVGYVSFESVNHPSKFLRHQDYFMKLHQPDGSQLFRDESSFKIVPALNGNSQQISIESFKYPGFYIISDNNYRCKIVKLENNNDFRNQASWQQTDALINRAYPQPQTLKK